MRQAGILLPVFSLPSNYGIGTFGKCAYEFIDFLAIAKQKYWQVLPLGPTSFKDSPYQSFSSFAGNPYFIDLDLLKEEGLLTDEDLSSIKNSTKIDYALLYQNRYPILRLAYMNFKPSKIYQQFIKENDFWLNDYALFMSLKKQHGDISWNNWPDEYKYYNQKSLKKFSLENIAEINFWKFLQFQFNQQWQNLKNYAHQHDIQIIGDIPIYVAYDSADVWSNVKQFQLDAKLEPINVAGCPPDAFCEDGQLWGNPLYNYHLMKEENYKWWVNRMKKAYDLYDVIRIDHFRGFEAYYCIPASYHNAKNGKWIKGPGYSLFKEIEANIPGIKIIAEDLGFITEGVKKLLKKTGYPGMKVLEFAFDEKNDSDYLPHNHQKNSVVYTGTHDNLPIRGWFKTLTKQEKHFVMEYLMLTDESKICDQMVRVALSSVANLTIIPFQDYLGLDETTRINTPSTSDNNWVYRINKDVLSNELAVYIGFLTSLYKRDN